jgi:hypothetical protein
MKALIGLPILSNGASQKNGEIGPCFQGFRNQPNGSKLFVLNGRFLNLARMPVRGSRRVGPAVSGLTPRAISYRRYAARRNRYQLSVAAPVAVDPLDLLSLPT